MELYMVRLGYDRWHDWDYFINIAPSTLPLKPISALESFLEAHRDQSFLEIFDYDPDLDGWKDAKRVCNVQCGVTTYVFLNDTCQIVRIFSKINFFRLLLLFHGTVVSLRRDLVRIKRNRSIGVNSIEWRINGKC
jgi:hypothetical protein